MMLLNPYMSYPVVGSSYDADAVTYFLAQAALGNVIADAKKTVISDAFVALKAAGLYNDIVSLTVTKWADANYNKLNLVNPVDSDAAHRQTYTGSPTHGSSGITTNGSSQYINTYVNPSTLNQNSLTFGLWLTGTPGNGGLMGCTNGGSRYTYMNKGTSNCNYGLNDGTNTHFAAPGAGLTLAIRTSSTDKRLSYSGANTHTATSTSGAAPNTNMLIGAYAQQGFSPAGYCALTTPLQIIINKGISTAESTTVYNILNTMLAGL